jgi:hypothetical protein
MKAMKTVSIFLFLIGFTQCGSTSLVKNPPFKIESATYTNWVGGVPGVSGKRVTIKLSEKTNITFDSLFFQKRKTKIELIEANGVTVLIGHFSTSKAQARDLVLHVDSTKELKNKAPKPDTFPFELKENEAIISYIVGNETRYYKIENIKKEKADLFSKIK